MSIQANTIAFPARRAFAAGLPADVTRDETTLDVTALAVANLAGESWAEMNATRQEEFRQWALLAATLSHPDGLRLIGYSMGKTIEPLFESTSEPMRSFRLGRVDALMGALRGAAARLAGVCDADRHGRLLALIRHDASHAARPW